MHVAIVTETYPPEVNGVAVTLAQLVDALTRRGHEVELVRPRQHDSEVPLTHAPRETLVGGLPVPCYPQLRFGIPSGGLLRRLWTGRRPQLVHVATEGPLGWSAVRAARRLAVPVTCDFRTNFHTYLRHYGFAALQKPAIAYLRHFHEAAACTMVPTEALRAELAQHGLQRLRVVGRGVDIHRFDPLHRSHALREAWGVTDSQPVVGYVGRLAAEKNLDVLVHAFAAIAAQVPGARFVIVGDGPARAELEARCPGAIFAGHRHDADLAAHYASLDLLLFPSLTETFGNVTIEAMASGVPVLAFMHAAAQQLIVTGANGMLVPAGDAAAFAQAAVSLATDAALRSTLGRQARLSVAALGWDAIAGHVETLWQELIETRIAC
jgi:glycosyltransferase involved in cell wall biosynthesis